VKVMSVWRARSAPYRHATTLRWLQRQRSARRAAFQFCRKWRIPMSM
jgi:hypothetical protein